MRHRQRSRHRAPTATGFLGSPSTNIRAPGPGGRHPAGTLPKPVRPRGDPTGPNPWPRRRHPRRRRPASGPRTAQGGKRAESHPTPGPQGQRGTSHTQPQGPRVVSGRPDNTRGMRATAGPLRRARKATGRPALAQRDPPPTRGGGAGHGKVEAREAASGPQRKGPGRTSDHRHLTHNNPSHPRRQQRGYRHAPGRGRNGAASGGYGTPSRRHVPLGSLEKAFLTEGEPHPASPHVRLSPGTKGPNTKGASTQPGGRARGWAEGSAAQVRKSPAPPRTRRGHQRPAGRGHGPWQQQPVLRPTLPFPHHLDPPEAPAHQAAHTSEEAAAAHPGERTLGWQGSDTTTRFQAPERQTTRTAPGAPHRAEQSRTLPDEPHTTAGGGPPTP